MAKLSLSNKLGRNCVAVAVVVDCTSAGAAVVVAVVTSNALAWILVGGIVAADVAVAAARLRDERWPFIL